MALRVWLPLNGNLNNQGLNNVTITNNGATVDNNGKIGKCYSFDGVNDYIDTGWGNNHISKNLSICLWVKPLSSLNNKIVFGVLNGTNQRLYLGIKDNTYNIAFRGYSWGRTSNAPATINVWSHLVITVDNNGRVLLYQDSILTNETYISSSSTDFNLSSNIFLGGRSDGYFANCLINDVRIYDHCLSPKEIREISKGLILHYPLNDVSTLMSKCENIIWNQLYYDGYFNSMSGYVDYSYDNVTDTITFTNKELNTWSIFCRRASNTSVVGHKYLIKCYVKSSIDQTTEKFYVTKVNSGSTTSIQSKTLAKDVWTKFAVIHTNQTGLGYGFETKPLNNIGTYNVRNYQIFDLTQMFGEGNEPTLEEFEMMFPLNYYPYNTGTIKNLKLPVYDCSGYGNNGTITGILSLNTDSPRYNYSTYFDGSSYIKTNTGELVWTNFDTLTISAWMKPTTRPSGYSGSIGIGHNANAGHKTFAICNSTGKFTVNLAKGSYVFVYSDYVCPLNEWHHYAATLNGTELKMYIDGVLIKTYTVNWGTAVIHENPQFQVGVDLPGTDEIYTGYYSDVRIYSTALSEKSIKELYNISGYIDNSGDVFQYESEERCENLFKLEYWNETINLSRSGNKYVTYTDRNGSKAFPLNASWFYYGNNDERNYHLQGKFKENTQYKFDFWIDYDDIMYQGSNTYGGLTVYYTDGTSNSVLRGTGNSETPMGWQHKYFISAENKTIKGIYVSYNVQIPAFYRWDSTIVEIDNKSTKINKNGINSTGQFRECSDIAKINKGNHFDTNKIIEI